MDTVETLLLMAQNGLYKYWRDDLVMYGKMLEAMLASFRDHSDRDHFMSLIGVWTRAENLIVKAQNDPYRVDAEPYKKRGGWPAPLEVKEDH